jgi:hypothetical protein
MSLRTASNIVEKALELVGAVSSYERTGDSMHYEKGLDWFDMMIAEVVGVSDGSIWFFTPMPQIITLTANERRYDLTALLSTNIQFVTSVQLLFNGEQIKNLPLMTRDRYASVNQAMEDSEPEFVYIDIKTSPAMYVVPAVTESGWTVQLDGYGYTPDLRLTKGEQPHNFTAEWEMFLAYELATHLGNGPITRLDSEAHGRLVRSAAQKRAILEARRPGREQRKNPPITKLYY